MPVATTAPSARWTIPAPRSCRASLIFRCPRATQVRPCAWAGRYWPTAASAWFRCAMDPMSCAHSMVACSRGGRRTPVPKPSCCARYAMPWVPSMTVVIRSGACGACTPPSRTPETTAIPAWISTTWACPAITPATIREKVPKPAIRLAAAGRVVATDGAGTWRDSSSTAVSPARRYVRGRSPAMCAIASMRGRCRHGSA
ncbi:hypothetical protein EIELFIGP_03384 [Stenotrophomonas maltophilia]|nr:hypothetical protein EIELFIGP_03384 [Stenotrophomonas maltophilia]